MREQENIYLYIHPAPKPLIITGRKGGRERGSVEENEGGEGGHIYLSIMPKVLTTGREGEREGRRGIDEGKASVYIHFAYQPQQQQMDEGREGEREIEVRASVYILPAHAWLQQQVGVDATHTRPR